MNLQAKLFDDKIKIVRYTVPVQVYKQFNEDYKLNLFTGELFPYTFADMLRAEKNYIASVNRSRRTVKELSKRNKFKYHLTVTFNGFYIDRKNALEVQQTLKNILKRLKYHFGGISYIAVPEYHKDGAIHYHIMINFNREPKLQFWGKSRRGINTYHFHKNENFKRKDCMLQVQKLKENNVHYLIKYMTKEYSCPFRRRFSTSRGLVRPFVQDKIFLYIDNFAQMKESALLNGFTKRFSNEKTTVLEYKPKKERIRMRAAARGGADLFITDTKDENLEEFFYSFMLGYLMTQNEQPKLQERLRTELEKHRKINSVAEK